MLRFWRATVNTRNGLAFAIRSEQAVRESLERMRQETAKHPVEFEESCRATLAAREC